MRRPARQPGNTPAGVVGVAHRRFYVGETDATTRVIFQIDNVGLSGPNQEVELLTLRMVPRRNNPDMRNANGQSGRLLEGATKSSGQLSTKTLLVVL